MNWVRTGQRGLLSAAITLAAACQADLPTAAVSLPAALAAGPPTSVETWSRWETWHITWLGGCTTHQFVDGEFRMHLATQMITYADGSSATWQRVNVAGGTLTDVAGTEYVFQQLGSSAQYTDVQGHYEVPVAMTFKLISKGQELNEFVDITVNIVWDGVDLTVTSSYISECRGA